MGRDRRGVVGLDDDGMPGGSVQLGRTPATFQVYPLVMVCVKGAANPWQGGPSLTVAGAGRVAVTSCSPVLERELIEINSPHALTE
ncbi:hypothetical protein TPA0907_31670 [Micromonospora humidisoli]|nr:hypothetical protein TPA0907_31670 [Micromonospora sp. AKA109]